MLVADFQVKFWKMQRAELETDKCGRVGEGNSGLKLTLRSGGERSAEVI